MRINSFNVPMPKVPNILPIRMEGETEAQRY